MDCPLGGHCIVWYLFCLLSLDIDSIQEGPRKGLSTIDKEKQEVMQRRMRGDLIAVRRVM